ncbi:hypothetical protein PybrP1_002543 [[Pythium] brassicae (nom. inval.)]|nr:hypothetical protein PybrP1_002543 [[Pythium] brassicae (nom. inval.)]
MRTTRSPLIGALLLRRRLVSTAASTPSQAYEALVAQGALTPDPHQSRVTRKYLDRLQRQLDGYSLPSLSTVERDENDTVGAEKPSTADTNGAENPPGERVLVPRGLYLHGSVGTGKSMLMDLFFAHVATPKKRRVHFNKFMLEVHERVQRLKQAQLARFGRQRNLDLDPRRDAIAAVAEQIAGDSHVLCFDEFQVTDIADALIMRKLFGVFFSRGVVVVATSNTPPENLYHDGTNREYFLPFLGQLARHMKVVAIRSETDYRLLGEAAGERAFLFPLGNETTAALDAIYQALLGDSGEEPTGLRVPVMMGRQLHVRGSRRGVCRASFDALCNTEKGAADYKALCDMREHDQARRFILLVDELYEHRTRLVCSAAVPPDAIFRFDDAAIDGQAEATEEAAKLKAVQLAESAAQGIPPASSWDAPIGAYNPAKMPGLQVQNLCSLQDLRVAFKRAVSRLHEMQSAKYVAQNAALRDTRQARLRQVL